MENSSKQREWGGLWTEEKLDCFESYVRAYLTIMNAYRDKFHWKLLYFDGFAGCGSRGIEDKSALEQVYGDNKIDEGELKLYMGAAERVVRLEQKMRGFDFYYFVDVNEDNLTRLELKLAPYVTTGSKVFRPDNANNQLWALSKGMQANRNLKTLCFLDPFGMHIDWDSIVAVAGPSVDLWILVPTGSIVNRLIQKNGELRYPDKLQCFFGLPEEEIKKRLFVPKTDLTLFGEETKFEKVKGAIQEIANIYCDQLGQLFPYVTSKPLVLRNSNNVPIFHLVCASHNATAVKIAQQIISKQQQNH